MSLGRRQIFFVEPCMALASQGGGGLFGSIVGGWASARRPATRVRL